MKVLENLKPYQEFIYKDKYLAKDEQGNVIESISSMYARVARTVAEAEKENIRSYWFHRFYDMMTNLDFLPNSPTIMNAGLPLGQLFACFVLPIEDSIESIGRAVLNTMLIQKSGGGTGFSFSRIRPKGSAVASTGGVASGVISWVKLLDATSNSIKQGGKRRGANMGVLKCDHPEILEFINCKKNEGDINNFNLSVAITNKFMEAVRKDRDWHLKDPNTGKITKTLKAKTLFNEIVNAAWHNGEPGIIFIDEIIDKHPLNALGEIEATNPCGEQPLLPYESCVLGSINLSNMVENGKINYSKLGRTIDAAVRFLDNAIDVNKYPLKEIELIAKQNRKIGLGVMGFADMLIKLGIKYDSYEALELTEYLSKFIRSRSIAYSEMLAKEKGEFPTFKLSNIKIPRRNATTNTIAPTGTISQIADVSGGIEPNFDKEFYRYILEQDGTKKAYKFTHELADSPYFRTANQIPAEWHIKIQATWQKNICNAVSKTINAPNSMTKEELAKAIFLGWRLGLKGFTIYRDGSRQEQVLNRTDNNNNENIQDNIECDT